MKQRLEKCPICNSSNFIEYVSCKDHMVSKETFTIEQCTTCWFLLTNPRPSLQSLPKYYKSDQYISHTDKSNNLTNRIYKVARSFTLKNKLKLVNQLTENKSILDFGCGTGDFLQTCKMNGWEIHGFEPDQSANSIASKKNRITIQSTLEDLTNTNELSVITLWHVLEHVYDLNATIEILTQNLARNGQILIAVPNYRSYDASLYKKHWAAYDVPRHLYHFDQQTMKELLSKHGLTITDTIPMKLDSFYVSLLSEKYLNNSTKFLKSFITGYKSNIYAKKHENNYSSLIYIAQK